MNRYSISEVKDDKVRSVVRMRSRATHKQAIILSLAFAALVSSASECSADQQLKATWQPPSSACHAVEMDHASSLAIADGGHILVSSLVGQTLWSVEPNGEVTQSRIQPVNSTFGPLLAATKEHIYLADPNNLLVERLNPDYTRATISGRAGVSVYMDGAANIATFGSISAFTADPGHLYVADGGVIRSVSFDGTVVTLVGSHHFTVGDDPTKRSSRDGNAHAATFADIVGIASFGDGTLVVSESGGTESKIRRVSQAGRVQTLLRTRIDAKNNGYGAVAIDSRGDILFSESHEIDGSQRTGIKKIDVHGFVSDILRPGAGGIPIWGANAMVLDADHNIYVADVFYGRIVKINEHGDVRLLCKVTI